MTSPESERLGVLWSTLQVPETATAQPPRRTILPDTEPFVPLPREPGPPLELLGELGRGGMGVVHRALQVSLQREVAVKEVERGGRAALREALVAGYLEHPDIVPVYTVEASPEGRPLIVMKRIEGVLWSECLADPELAPRMRPADPLEWHLDVLVRVCRAVQYAHERGILHRDIKPENVMIGWHGDVYLLDWGLAVALDPALAERVPLAHEVKRIAGTPGYMAPEMVRGEGAALGPATDVYLLGATLHEILLGRVRHEGADLRSVLESSHESEPFDYPETVPAELAALCNHAMQADPRGRLRSADELAEAVEAFARRRPALRLASHAEELLSELRERLGARDPEASDPHDAFGQCLAAAEEALHVWPDHAPSAHVREQAILAMLAFEVDRHNPEAASELMARLRRPPDEELARRFQALREDARRRDEEHRALKKLEYDVDARRGARLRAMLVMFFGASVLAHNLVYGRLLAAGAAPESAAAVLAGPFVLLAGLAAIWFPLRQRVFGNRVNRQLFFVLSSLALTIALVRVVGVLHGAPVRETYSYLGGVYALGAAVVASLSDPRIHLAAVLLAAGAILSLVVPSFGLEIIGLSVFAATSVMAVLWWRSARPRPDGERAR